MQRIHFISGLPRSGSTLLAAILRQNPRFHAGMSSPLAAIYMGALERMGGRNEFHVLMKDEQRAAVTRGIFESFYAHLDAETVVFDTNRVWCAKLSGIVEMFPDAKVICCVRRLAWVLDSFERILNRNPLATSRVFNHDPGGTVYSRTETLMKRNGAVGISHGAFKEAFYGPHGARLLVVNYESLAGEPLHTMNRIYKFLGEPPFEHDFENVEFEAGEYDFMTGMPGLHTVRRRVEYSERKTILPPDIFTVYLNSAFWNEPKLNPGHVQVV